MILYEENEYKYTELITVTNIFTRQGGRYTEEWSGDFSKDDEKFAYRKMCCDYQINPKDVIKFFVEQVEVERNTGWPASELYGGGNCWSASGDCYSTGDWVACQY